MNTKRIKRVQKELKKKNLDALFISNPANVFYLSELRGFDDRDFLMIVSKNSFKVIAFHFYQAEVERKVPDNYLLVERKQEMFDFALEALPRTIFSRKMARGLPKHFRIGFEEEDVRYVEFKNLNQKIKDGKIIPTSGIIENMRKIKDKEEIRKIKKAAEITDKAFLAVLRIIKPGLTEKFIQRRLIGIMQDLGTDGLPFEPIVASGKNSASVHHLTSGKRFKNNDILLIDMGAKYKGYCADFTRTVFLGTAKREFRQLYNIVLKTQEMAIKKCKQGYPTKKLFGDAASNFRKYKEEKYFLHSLGHGIGVDYHELPHLGPKREGKFEKGMVFTIEPGLYHKNLGGIRIEDCCVLDKNCQVLSKVPKNLIEIKTKS